MKTMPFIKIAILFVLAVGLCSCSPQSATAPANTNLPTALSVAQPGASATQLPTTLPTASPTSQPSPTASIPPATLEFDHNISGDPNPFSMAANLALDANGDIYVLDGGNGRVQVYDHSGKFINMWGSQGSGDGQFNLLVHEAVTSVIGGIVVDKNKHVYVGDGLNARIQEFDSRGNFLMKWGSHGSNDGQFLSVVDLALDAQGNIYAVDENRDDIQKFDPQGKFILKFGEEGAGPGQLTDTGDITIGPDGNLYIADYGNNRIEVFSLDGKYLRQWHTPVLKVVDIAIDSHGNIFTTHKSGDIVEYDPTGKPISIMANIGLDSPRGIVIGPDGLIYIADNKGIEVFREK